MDFSFWGVEEREKYKRMAIGAGASVQLYHLECLEPVCSSRRRARNASLQPGEFFVSDETYAQWKDFYELPLPSERAIRVRPGPQEVMAVMREAAQEANKHDEL